MKHLKRTVTLLTLALLILCLPLSASARSSMFGSDGDPAWVIVDNLNAHMADADYVSAQAALKVLEECYPELMPQYREYTLYLEALGYIEAKNFQKAAAIYEGLSQKEGGFYESKLLHAYCSGRVYEAAADYEKAIEFYEQAITYADAPDRIQNCRTQITQTALTNAQSLYQRGLASNNVELLKEAETSFQAINNTHMVLKCREAIDNINNQAAYDSAMKQYEDALAAGSMASLKTASAAFAALGSYSDSAEKAEAINALITAMQRTLTLTASNVTTDGITISWTDSSTEETSYTVSWAPVNNKTRQSQTVTEKTITLSSLLPNTTYQIIISAQNAPQPLLTLEISTSRAANYDAAGFRMSYARLFSTRRSLLMNATIGELLTKHSKAVTFPENNEITLENIDATLQSTAYAYAIGLKQNDPIETEVTFQFLLRTREAGVYASEVYTATYAPGKGTTAPIVVCALDELLDPLFIDQGSWPTEPCTVELYLNGMFAARCAFTIRTSN